MIGNMQYFTRNKHKISTFLFWNLYHRHFSVVKLVNYFRLLKSCWSRTTLISLSVAEITCITNFMLIDYSIYLSVYLVCVVIVYQDLSLYSSDIYKTTLKTCVGFLAMSDW